jgi:hypothetical protein
MRSDFIFSWFRDVNHTTRCREFRRAHPEYVESVKYPPVDEMKMTNDTWKHLKAIEPVPAWRWKWKHSDAWKRVLRPMI